MRSAIVIRSDQVGFGKVRYAPVGQGMVSNGGVGHALAGSGQVWCGELREGAANRGPFIV